MNSNATPAAVAANAAPRLNATLETAAVMTALAAAACQSENIDGSHHVTLPPGYTHKDVTSLVEQAQPQPDRKRGTVAVKNVDSLLACLADQAEHGAQDFAYVYADPDCNTIAAVFNDQRADTPGWRDYRVVFKAEFTREYARWKDANGKHMGQTEFAEFIEDNLADITEPAAQQLLDVVTTIQAKTDINFSSGKRLDNGQNQLTYNETIDARAGANGALQIPRVLGLGLRVFKNEAGYKLTARLKYRLGGGGVKFWFELDRPELVEEAAFAEYTSKVADESGYRVLLGKP